MDSIFASEYFAVTKKAFKPYKYAGVKYFP